MLVLSRKASERIHIGDGIVVEVRRVAGNRVTLAVEAPREMRILRGELYEAAKSFEAQPDEVEAASESNKESRCIVPQLNLVPLEGAAQSVA